MMREITKSRMTILGLAYKANVDDTRESPAFKIARIAENEGIDVVFHYYVIWDHTANIEEIYKTLEGYDCNILVKD